MRSDHLSSEGERQLTSHDLPQRIASKSSVTGSELVHVSDGLRIVGRSRSSLFERESESCLHAVATLNLSLIRLTTIKSLAARFCNARFVEKVVRKDDRCRG